VCSCLGTRLLVPGTPYNRCVPDAPPHTWILTASPENHEATRAHGFTVIGIKERNRPRTLQIEPGDRIVLYLTKVMAFAGSIRVAGEMYEERKKIWPGKPGKADAYPWRFPTEPEIVLEEDEWVPAEELATKLEHIRKWPAEHWKLAFQGQLRTVSEKDAKLLVKRLATRTHQLLEDHDAAVNRIMANPKSASSYRAELSAWDGTLEDGLSDL
jgi:hypothetical protein